MASMKTAYFYGGKDIRVVEEDIPVPGPGEVLFKVMSAGVCGSDLHNYRGHQAREGAPWQQGHELSGEITVVGEGVSGLEPGQRVGIEAEHLLGCGNCRWCREGQYQICPDRGLRSGTMQSSHGFSQYDVCFAENVTPLPDDVSFDSAALLDCYACGVHAVNRVPDVEGEAVAIIGAGAIALTLGQVLKARGAGKVILVGTRSQPVDVAVAAGSADVGVVTAERDPVGAVLDATGGEGAAVTFETVGGQAQLIQQALEMTRSGGVVSVIGAFTKLQTIDSATALGRELTVQWSHAFSTWKGESEYAITLGLLVSGKFNPGPIITHHFAIDDISQAFAAADGKRGSGAIRVMVHPNSIYSGLE